ncbi:hypothetical protein V8E36_008374 [Tilletia maclaganii]
MFATPASLFKLAPLCFLLLAFSPTDAKRWAQTSDIRGHRFYDAFSFFNSPDPTHGQVDYSQGPSLSWVDGKNRFNMKVDTHQNVKDDRGSVRITSKFSVGDGVIVANISHAPTGCAVWPSFWTFGSNWPYKGEIDMLEWANNAEYEQGANSITLHTQKGCHLPSYHPPQRGRIISENCDVFSTSNQGCQIRARSKSGNYSATAGKGFNAAQGGVVAMERDFSSAGGKGIRVWQWARNDKSSMPSDVRYQSQKIDTSTWGTPTAYFNVNPGCKFAFGDHNIVFNIALGGDWASNAWAGTSCQRKYGSIENFIKNRGDAFRHAYWSVDSVKHFV